MAGLRARPSVVPRACSNEWTELGPAQTDAVITYLRRLGVVGAQGALYRCSNGRGRRLGFGNEKLKIDGRGSTIYRYCRPISCATRIRTRFYLDFDSNAGLLRFEKRFGFGVHWGIFFASRSPAPRG
jgi:hypothetical protein